MREFKLSKAWAILVYITVPLLIALFLWLLLMPFLTGSQIDMNSFWLLSLISIAMIAFLVIGLVDAIKGKFVIDQDKIYIVSAFSTKQMMLRDIKGYRFTENYVFIESNTGQKIKVSTYFGNFNEITKWLAEHFSDLDLVQTILEKEEILNNEAFGWSTEQREEKLIKAQKITKILNWTGGIIGAWILILPNPYEYAIIATIVFPIICVLVLKFSRGLIRINERKDSAYPSIFIAILATSMGLFLRALLDYEIFDYSKIWTPSILIALTFTTVLILGNKEFKFNSAKDFLTVLSFTLFSFAYGYGAVVTLNCAFDKSKPETFHASVISKRISDGKHTSYYVELTSWGKRKEVEEVTVSKDLYNRLEKNDKVRIYFLKGKLNIPWFVVSEE
jgi:hypothetical protein